jgi:hypothetical protein
MAKTPAPASPEPDIDPTQKFRQLPIFGKIINELDVNKDQLAKRQKLIGDIEAALTKKYKKPNRMIVYMMRFGHSKSMIQSADIPPLDAILNSISNAEELNVLIQSPGGDGSIIEKMVEMCRGHLSYRDPKLRVIVPNIAKSAATVFSLGADKIIMGYSSDLGPIDPQVPIIVSGAAKYVSASAFVETRDLLMKQLAEAIKKNEPTQGILTQIAGLNTVFIHEMENAMNFSKQTAIRMLEKYMLKGRIKDAKARTTKAGEIAEKLLSKQLFPIHGHFIGAATAKNDLELEVEILDRQDELWKLIWEYYIRAEIQMDIPSALQQQKIKLFESATHSLVSQAPPDVVRQPQMDAGL